VEPDGSVAFPCARGCYHCLLSYRNQVEHELINRHLARDLLLSIAHGDTVTTGQGISRTEDAIRLIGQSGSTLEEEFVQWLKDNGYRLPDSAQEAVDGAYARPDFTYQRPGNPVAVFIDGPHHDDAVVAERDASAQERLEDRGWYVIRFRYDDDWARITAENPGVFGTRR
jgi:very-short-patch-repair endonuclease